MRQRKSATVPRIHGPDVQMFLNQKAQHYAPSVLHHIRATLSRVFATAKEWGYVESNPASNARLPKSRAVRPKIIFDPPHLENLIEALKEPYRTMVLVAAVTGMRISELLGLKWSDVDFERRLLHVRRAYYRGNFGSPCYIQRLTRSACQGWVGERSVAQRQPH